MPAALRITLWSTKERPAQLLQLTQEHQPLSVQPQPRQGRSRRRPPLPTRPGHGRALPVLSSCGTQPAAKAMAGGSIVPEQNPQAPSTLHQAGANALTEGVPEPRHQADAQGDCVGGAEVLAPEESAAEVTAKLRGSPEPPEPHFTSSASI